MKTQPHFARTILLVFFLLAATSALLSAAEKAKKLGAKD